MSDCLFCDLIAKKANLLYEDDKLVVMLNPKPALPGHLLILPREHAPIFEKIKDNVIQDMFLVANKVGIAAFENLGAHGTNVLIQNGPAAGQTQNHAMLHVIPRFENDGLKLEWSPGAQADPGKLESVANLIKEHTGSVGIIQKEKQKPIEQKAAKEVEEDDWRSKQFKRIP